MDEDQLAAMEVSAPLLVSEYRKLKHQLTETQTTYLQMFILARRLLYTVRSGVLNYSNIESMTHTARELGVVK